MTGAARFSKACPATGIRPFVFLDQRVLGWYRENDPRRCEFTSRTIVKAKARPHAFGMDAGPRARSAPGNLFAAAGCLSVSRPRTLHRLFHRLESLPGPSCRSGLIPVKEAGLFVSQVKQQCGRRARPAGVLAGQSAKLTGSALKRAENTGDNPEEDLGRCADRTGRDFAC